MGTSESEKVEVCFNHALSTACPQLLQLQFKLDPSSIKLIFALRHHGGAIGAAATLVDGTHQWLVVVASDRLHDTGEPIHEHVLEREVVTLAKDGLHLPLDSAVGDSLSEDERGGHLDGSQQVGATGEEMYHGGLAAALLMVRLQA